MNNKPYFLALNRIPGIGPATVRRLLKRYPCLADLFQLSIPALCDDGLSENLARLIRRFDFTAIDDDLKWETKTTHSILSWEDDAYPSLLREIAYPPLVLYVQGDTALLSQPQIAIVGTRQPTVSGRETAWRFGYDLAQAGLGIVSGLALGIDSAAHEGCLAAHGKTLAILGTGIDKIYPYRHRSLAAQIGEKGALISEFPLKTPPLAGHFPRRNRIISGLSSATLIVEATIRSGSLITAQFALEQNRDVFAIPGSIHNIQATGCHFLLQQGAKLVVSYRDVLEELQLLPLQEKTALSQRVPVQHEQTLVDFIGFEPTSVDCIVARSGLKIENVMGQLTELEMQRLIHQVPGGYMRCIL